MKESLLGEQTNSLGWYGGFTDVRPRLLSFCSIISMCGCHLQGYLIIQDGCWSFHHHICAAGRKREKAKGQKKRVPFQMYPISLSSLPVTLPTMVLLKSCVPEISHLAKPWCKGGWEIQAFPLSMRPAKSPHFITRIRGRMNVAVGKQQFLDIPTSQSYQ